jgi:4-amino-4-deoxy-L-arabinose transferase-like glycosyltransferase
MPLQSTPSSEAAEQSPSGPYRALKQFGLVLLCGAWITLGLVGHDPWKIEDATAFGVAWNIMQSGNWLAPTLAGEPFVDRPPLAYGVAALFGHAFGGVLPPHDAARLAAGAFLALTLTLLNAAARELYGRGLRWLPMLLLIGSVGMWDRAHQLSPEMGLLLGVALAQYGFALALRRAAVGGAMIGLGIAIAFLSRGFMGPLWLALTAIALPLVSPAWRTRSYATTVGVALAIALPLAGAWPALLAARAPAQLQAWWAVQSIGDYVFPLSAEGAGDPLLLIRNLPWFAWPALPLVLWTLWTRGRGFNGGLATPAVVLPATLAVAIAVCLTAMAEPRAIYALPLLLPLCLIAALEIDTLPRGFSGALDWFGILTFGLLAAIVWWAWFDAWAHGISPAMARIFRDTEPGFRPPWQWLAVLVSVFLTLLWLVLVRPARRSNRRAVLNWAAGMALVWGLYMSIWLPYLDSRRSYRSVAEALAHELPAAGCTASRNLGEAQRALLQYFANIVTIREEKSPEHDCAQVLVQYGRADGEPIARLGWEIAWQGHRRGDDTERFVLYRRSTP